MEEKLRSIIRPIPWSSLLKPVAIAAAWLTLPGWWFVAVAAVLYLYPFFRPLSTLAPFVAILILGFVVPRGFFQAAYMAIAMFLVFGVKDLAIVGRRTAYELLVFLISFAGCLALFSALPSWSDFSVFTTLALCVVLWLWMIRMVPDTEGVPTIPYLLAGLVFFEVGIAVLILPLNFFSQAALLFLGSVFLFGVAANSASISTKKFLIWGGSYAALSLVVALLTSWKI